MNDSTKERLQSIIRKHTSQPWLVLDSSTCVQSDLGLDGDQGYDFIEDIQKVFQIDLQLIDDKYFYDELSLTSQWLLTPLIYLLHQCHFRTELKIFESWKRTDLLVSDIEKAIELGYWQAPERKPRFPWDRRRPRKK